MAGELIELLMLEKNDYLVSLKSNDTAVGTQRHAIQRHQCHTTRRTSAARPLWDMRHDPAVPP
jgi:hypothetical protein